MDEPVLDGKGKQICSVPGCGRRSLTGLVRGEGVCPYHWAAGNWGTDWAKRCFPNYTPRQDKKG